MKELCNCTGRTAVMVLALVFALGLGFSWIAVIAQSSHLPQAVAGGFDLPNGWRITPAGKIIADTEDMVLKMTAAPDGRAVIATYAGYNPHGLVVIDTTTHQVVQRIGLKSTWLGLAWAPDGKTLYVSGGNANGSKVKPTLAPIYEFSYSAGRLSPHPTGQLDETIPLDKVYWSGLAHHPTRELLYAANRGTNADPSNIVVFDGHSWSTSAYATDFTERRWPPHYGGISQEVNADSGNSGPETVPDTLRAGRQSARSEVLENSQKLYLLLNHSRDLSTPRLKFYIRNSASMRYAQDDSCQAVWSDSARSVAQFAACRTVPGPNLSFSATSGAVPSREAEEDEFVHSREAGMR